MSGAPVFAPIREESTFGDKPTEFKLVVIGINAGHVPTEGSDGIISQFVNSTALARDAGRTGIKQGKAQTRTRA
jgi:hypothetical protein